MKKLFLAFCISISSAASSNGADVLPADRRPTTWEPGVGVGVKGGIPSASWTVIDMTTHGFATGNSGATNSAALLSAVNTYAGTDTVLYIPAGDYAFAGSTIPQNRNRVAIRGAGMFQTKLTLTSGGQGLSFGGDPGYGQPAFNPYGTVLSGFTKDSSTIVVQSNGNGVPFRSAEFLYCSIPNDPTIPVLKYSISETGVLDHMNYVTTAVNNGDGTFTLTLHRPIGRDYLGTITINQPQPGLTGSRLTGIEDLTIDCASVPGRNGVVFSGSLVDSWVKNVRVLNADNYPFSIYTSVMCTVTGCFAADSIGSGSSHAGIAIYSNCNGVLVEDSIVVGNAAGIIVQTATNCVVSHNFITKCAVPLTPNHAAFPHHNAYEGNAVININSDGTHGGTSTSLFHRNWIYAVTDQTGNPVVWNTTTGLPTGGQATYGFSAKRWTVKYSLIRNIFGSPGYAEPNSGVISVAGQPNLGNGVSDGFGTYGGAAATLATRTSDSTGSLTAPTGHGIPTGSTIDVYWGKVVGGFGESYIRRSMTVGTVSGTTIPVSGGFGDALPTAGSSVFFPTDNTAIRTYPQDWDGINFRPHRWTATVTSMDIPNSLVVDVVTGDLSVAQARVARAIANDVWSAHTAMFRLLGYQTAQITSPMSGTTITFDVGLAFWESYPVVGQTLTLDPSSAGFQELDLDVKRTALLRGNKTYLGTALHDAMQEGETSPTSYIYPTRPAFLTGYGFPVFDADDIGALSARRLPAGDRYMTFLDTGSFGSVGGSATATAITANVGTLNLAP